MAGPTSIPEGDPAVDHCGNGQVADVIPAIPRRGRGRPTKFTPENCQRILISIALGSPYTLAPLSAGVDYATFRLWIQRGERERSGAFFDFAEAVKRAEGAAAERWLAVIEKAAMEGNWTAAAWKLERRYPDKFGRVSVDVRAETKHTERIEVEQRVSLHLPDERVRNVLRIMTEVGALNLTHEGGNGDGHDDAPR